MMVRRNASGWCSDPPLSPSGEWWRHRNVVRRRVAGRCALTETSLEPDFRTSRHRHDAAFLCLFLRGTLDESYRKASCRLRAGHAVLYGPQAEHDGRVGGHGTHMLNIEFPAVALGEDERLFRVNQIHERDVSSDASFALAWRVYRAHALAAPSSTLRALAAELVDDLTRRRDGGRDAWLEEAREMLADQLDEAISVRDVAEEFRRHPSHVARAFRDRFGCTISEHLRRLRFAAAARRLTENTVPIAAVAVDAGFSDQSHLGRVVKSYTGLTPAAYRHRVTARPDG